MNVMLKASKVQHNLGQLQVERAYLLSIILVSWLNNEYVPLLKCPCVHYL